jgi:hypothetical protein
MSVLGEYDSRGGKSTRSINSSAGGKTEKCLRGFPLVMRVSRRGFSPILWGVAKPLTCSITPSTQPAQNVNTS